MRKFVSPSLVCSILLSAVLAVIFFVDYGSLPSTVPTHWSFPGVVDAWGPKSNALVIPIILVILTVVATVLRCVLVAFRGVGAVVDVIDVFLPFLTGVLGCAATMMLSNSDGNRQASYPLPVSVFTVVLSVCLILSGGVSVKSHRTLLTDPKNGSCIMDLSVSLARRIWVGSLLCAGVIGLLVSLLIESRRTYLTFPGGIAGLCIIVLLTVGLTVVVIISNTALLRTQRLNSY
jgi:uncharacterized membrane protein